MSEFSTLNGYKVKDKKAIRFYDNVALMKSDTTLKNGMHVKTKGYYEINDGGSAYYHIRELNNSDIVDEGIIISLNNELIAELITDDVNLMHFGCYGDGEHDDTININKAINYASNSNLPISSPYGKIYLLSDVIVLPDVNLNLSNCTFKTDYGIKITASSKELNLPKIDAISELSTNNGVELFECYTNKIYVPYIHNFTTGLILTANEHGCVYNNITIQEICNCITSLKLYPTGTGWVNENMFIGGRLWNTGTFTTAHASDIKIIHSQGNSNSTCNNNYYLHQCIEGHEGTDGGLKIKLEYTNWCIFEDLRYEGNNPKVDITNSLYNVLNNGYMVSNLTFVNDKPIVNVNGISTIVPNAGTIGGTNAYLDLYMSGNTRASVQTRRTTGTIANKITPNGIIMCNNSENETIKLTEDGLQTFFNNAWQFMFRSWGKYILFPKCDSVNSAIVINDGTNVNNGCFLWIYNGHLYGKMGQPNSESDGTIII